MNGEYVVAIGERLQRVGTVRFGGVRERQISFFRYAEEWIENPSAFALAPSLPLSDQRFHFASLPDDSSTSIPGVFSDCAPDAWGRSLIVRASGTPRYEMGYVLAVDDRTRQGALRFLDDEGNPLADDAPPTPRVLDLSRLQSLCQNIESGIGDLGALARELRGATASLGGARPKSVVVDENGTLHVAKFTMLGDTMPVERVEVATLSLARDLGIRAVKATLARPAGTLPVALVERFDREPGEYGRRHYMSAQTLLEARRGESRFYTDIADGLRAVCRTDMEALEEMAELHRRILFTILVSNNDDHLKNHGLLYAGEGSWALAPAFDINPQPFRHRELKTGISEISGFDASVEAWVEAAPFFERTEDEARRQAAAMAETVSSRWRNSLLANGLTEDQCNEYVPAFEHEEARVALRMGSPSVAVRDRSPDKKKPSSLES